MKIKHFHIEIETCRVTVLSYGVMITTRGNMFQVEETTHISFAFKLNMHTSIFLVKSSHILNYYGKYVLSLILMYRVY